MSRERASWRAAVGRVGAVSLRIRKGRAAGVPQLVHAVQLFAVESVGHEPAGDALDGEFQVGRCVVQRVHGDAGVLPGPGRGGVHHRDGQLAGHGAGHPVLELVGFIHHHNVVFRQHGQALERADGQHRVVGDDDVGVGGVLPGQFAEAFGRQGALLRAEALHGGDGDLPPGPVRDAGQKFVAVPRDGVLGPFAQPDDLLAELGGRAAHGRGEVRHGSVLAEGEELALRGLFRGESAFELVAAHVVGAALDQGHFDGPVQRRGDGLEQPGQVPAHDLGLQGQGGGGDQGGLVADERVRDQRDQVREGLAGSGAGLDQQVVAAVNRLRHLPGHFVLALAALAAHAGHGTVEQFDHELPAGFAA